MQENQRPHNLSRVYAWFSAIAADDLGIMRDLLAHGMPIDVLHPLRHSTALMEATRLGRASTVQWLLEQGATPAFLCGLPLGSALHCALRRRHWSIAHILADAMENCSIMDAYGATPLHTLCAEADSPQESSQVLSLPTLLINKQCALNALDHEGTTALHHCVVNGQLELALILLRHGANPNVLIPDSLVSPLTIAALEKNMAMAQLLLQFGADPQLRTRDGATASSIYPALAPLIQQCPPMSVETLGGTVGVSQTVIH